MDKRLGNLVTVASNIYTEFEKLNGKVSTDTLEAFKRFYKELNQDIIDRANDTLKVERQAKLN